MRRGQERNERGRIISLVPREKDLITFQHSKVLLFSRPPFPLTNNGPELVDGPGK